MAEISPKNIALFFFKVRVVGSCWEWIGSKTHNGYGHLGLNGKMTLSHRFCYEFFNGCIPDGLELDHICRNKSCVNPDHLEAVSHIENCLRGDVNQNKFKTHCPLNHEYTPKNTYRDKKGKRSCKLCTQIRNKNRYLKPKGVAQK